MMMELEIIVVDGFEGVVNCSVQTKKCIQCVQDQPKCVSWQSSRNIFLYQELDLAGIASK